MTDRLIGVRAKIERAKNHIRDLESRILTFRETNPYRLTCEQNPQTSERTFKSHIHSTPSPILSLITGEAIYQLRSSLDHLAWQLVEANGKPAGKWTYFPISETATKYKAESPGKVKGMSPDAIHLIDSIKPYQGGNDPLWKLHKLNNFDKHQLLLVIVGGLSGFRFGGGAEAVSFDHPLSHLFTAIRQQWGPQFVPTTKLPIVQDSAELATISWVGGPPPEMDKNLNLSFEIAFSEPQIVKGEPVVPLLTQLSQFVEGVINQFVPFL